jgi:2-hydroxy-3-keto-5-methylthiopentenyl-1-phosphate phosphatase
MAFFLYIYFFFPFLSSIVLSFLENFSSLIFPQIFCEGSSKELSDAFLSSKESSNLKFLEVVNNPKESLEDILEIMKKYNQNGKVREIYSDLIKQIKVHPIGVKIKLENYFIE